MNKNIIDNGGSAFPHETGARGIHDGNTGMTLRDYFAAKAIDRMICLSSDNEGGWDPAAVAAGCYAVADAMLEYRRDDELDLDPRTPEYGVGR